MTIEELKLILNNEKNSASDEIFRQKLSLFDSNELEIILSVNTEKSINFELLEAISYRGDDDRAMFLKNIQSILESDNPFDIMQKLINDTKPKDSFEQISQKYWKAVLYYLKDLKITKNEFWGINMVRAAAKKGYKGLSDSQKFHLKKNTVYIEYFDNSYLQSKGFEKEIELIKMYNE